MLVDPPWRRATGDTAEPRPTSLPSPPSPRLVWRDGEREELAGAPPKPLAEEAEERLLERLLEHNIRGRPLPTAELGRISIARLAEIADDIHPDGLDAPGLKLMLGRVGDRFAARAATIIRARPPKSGLFAAAGAALRAAELGPVAAALLATRELPAALDAPFTETEAELWLERHPEAAAAGLIAPAFEASTRVVARVALRWIALSGHLPSARATLSAAGAAGAMLLDELEPFAALAPLRKQQDLSWLPLLVARGQDARALELLEDVAGAEAAPWVARALGGPARDAARAWLERHRAAVEPVLRKRARGEGTAAREALVALDVLAGDPTAGDPALADVPAAIPVLPAFFVPESLPAPRLRDGTPLPTDAVRALGEMLRFSSSKRPYAGITQVRTACDPESLDAFALALIEAWIAAGSEPLDRWALDAAGKIGGDGCAREIGRRVRSWATGAHPPQRAWDDDDRSLALVAEGDRGWAYAGAGCAALAAIGTDLALTLLDDLARTGASSWLRREATRALDGVREGRKVRPADLEDGMVPDLGLDATGSLLLDFGARTFRVGFDEALGPHVLDEAGARLRAFPRPRREDDAALAEEAKRRFQSLSRDAKVLARQQIAQLESAMCSRRRWRLDAFQERFVQHPLLRHLGRRLLWAALEPGELSPRTRAEPHLPDARTFRVAEDLSLTSVEDARLTAAEGAEVLLVHPVELSPAARARWTEIFADYQIVQPFPQLGRPIAESTEEDRGRTEVAELAGAKTSRGRIFALARRGWTPRAEGGVVTRCIRELPAGASAGFEISPGIPMGETGSDEEITIVRAWCTVALDRLPRIDYSELLCDLASARR